MKFSPLPAALLLGACSSAQPVANDFAANVSAVREIPADEGNGEALGHTVAAPDYAGRWTGVEGTYMQVAAGPTPGSYLIEMQSDLDTKTTVDARAEGDRIVFERGGKSMTLRPTTGEATGLKHLAGKKHCLTVATGEGYCRD